MVKRTKAAKTRKKSVKPGANKNNSAFIGGVLIALAILSISYLISGTNEKQTMLSSHDSQPYPPRIRIYDVNIPGGFFTVKNLETSSIDPNAIHFFVNGNEIKCEETISSFNPGQTLACTNSLVKDCKTIRVSSPNSEDTVSCE
jgi:hypothetical protein